MAGLHEPDGEDQQNFSSAYRAMAEEAGPVMGLLGQIPRWRMEIEQTWPEPPPLWGDEGRIDTIIPSTLVGRIRFALYLDSIRVMEIRGGSEMDIMAINGKPPWELLMEEANAHGSVMKELRDMVKEMKGSFVFCHLNDLETPRDGEVMTDRWWTFVRSKGVAFYKSAPGHLAPQCNRSRAIAESLQRDLMPDAEVVHVPVAYVGRDYQCGGKVQ